MKKLLLTLFSIGMIGMASCSSEAGRTPLLDTLYNEHGTTVLVLKNTEYGDSGYIQFSCDSTPDAVSMIRTALRYADWDAKHKMTYRLEGYETPIYGDTTARRVGMLYLDSVQMEYTVSIKGSCENSFGVRDEVTTYVKFTKDGGMKLDKNGLPDIFTF